MPLTRPNLPEEYRTPPDPGAQVIVRHPGYGDDPNPLIILAGFDLCDGRKGLHLGTAASICAILSGRRDGYFTNARDDAELDLGLDGLLEEGSYFFHVPGDPHYAIYLSFEHWQFPHDDLPEPYTHTAQFSSQSGLLSSAVSNATPEVMIRDQRCIVSRQRDCREKAHLCPKKEAVWFEGNRMRLYNRNQFLYLEDTVNDTANAIALRKDIHKAFDEKVFVFVMKEASWTTHFIRPTLDLGTKYHNLPVAFDRGVSTQFLYARFAWAIFPLVQPFLVSGPKRWVKVRVENNDGQISWARQFMGVGDIRAKVARTPSPQKRQRGDQGGQQKDSEATCTDRSTESTLLGSFEEVDTGASRGRSKRRRGSYGSHSPYASFGAHFNSKSLSIQPSFSQSEVSPARLASDPIRHAAASEADLDQNLLQEPAMDERRFDAYISNLRRKEIKARRPSKRSLYCCHYQEAEAEVERCERQSSITDAELGICEECKGYEFMQSDMLEVTFGKGYRDEAWSMDDVHLLGLPGQKETGT